MRARILAASLLSLILLASPASTAGAATLTPNTTADQDGTGSACSFREAVESANADADFGGCTHTGAYGIDTVRLPGGTYGLTENRVDVEDASGDAATILPRGTAPVTIDQRSFDVVLGIAEDTTIRGLTVTGGDRRASSIGGGIGVGNGAKLTLIDSTVTGNSVGDATHHGDGGGVGVTNGSSITLVNDTISGNTATRNGGGIADNGSTTSVSLTNVTVTGNQAGDAGTPGVGGGVRFQGDSVAIKDSIIAGNEVTGPGSIGPDCFLTADINSHDHTLVADPADCDWTPGAGDITGEQPKLGPLADNGGPTFTQALLAGSPAINVGAGCQAGDQRGVPRSLGGACDLGAYERVRCAGVVVDRVGTSGKDRLKGTSRADGILGLGGNDTLKGLAGKDGLCGGKGRDKLLGGKGKDKLLGQAGKDTLNGGPKPDRCKGGPGRDRQRNC